MKERIYTIPVTDVFSVDCECPLCLLNERFEKETVDYYLGPSLMEPDHRLETNEKGFCKSHFEMLYSRQENTLGLALIIETHLERLRKELYRRFDAVSSERAAAGANAKLTEELKSQVESCAICDKLDYTMERYIDVILYLWRTEPDFKVLFNNKKGFCLPHLAALTAGADKYLKSKDSKIFLEALFKMQKENLDELQEDINWFTKKFDYRNRDASWKNSRDAVPRSIRKLIGLFKER